MERKKKSIVSLEKKIAVLLRVLVKYTLSSVKQTRKPEITLTMLCMLIKK